MFGNLMTPDPDIFASCGYERKSIHSHKRRVIAKRVPFARTR